MKFFSLILFVTLICTPIITRSTLKINSSTRLFRGRNLYQYGQYLEAIKICENEYKAKLQIGQCESTSACALAIEDCTAKKYNQIYTTDIVRSNRKRVKKCRKYCEVIVDDSIGIQKCQDGCQVAVEAPKVEQASQVASPVTKDVASPVTKAAASPVAQAVASPVAKAVASPNAQVQV